MKWTRAALFAVGVLNLVDMATATYWWFAAVAGLVGSVCFVMVGMLWERYGAGPTLADRLAQDLYGARQAEGHGRH